jgi:hypothetical protein
VVRRKLVFLGVLLVAASAVTPVPASASGSSGTREISRSGVATIQRTGVGVDGVQLPEVAHTSTDSGTPIVAKNPPVDRSKTGRQADGNTSGDSSRGGSDISQVLSFDGLNHRASRLAFGGNQFSLEPPDQGLCAGNGFVMETINDVLRVYNTNGTPAGFPIALNDFYHYLPAINRSTGVFGPELTDPSCYFDVATQRWFHVELTLETDPTSGNFLGPNHLDLAVSTSSDPTGTWAIYQLPVQDDGTQGTPDHMCSGGADANGNPVGLGPCFGDYPHIGADANGFYITTNEYSFFGPEFKAAQIYAFSKRALARNDVSVAVTQFDTTGLVRGSLPGPMQAGFTVWPAEAANGHFATDANGTEYFLSSNAGGEVNNTGTSKDLVVWALTNTASLDSASASLSLTNQVLTVPRYAIPAPSVQKPGNAPLRDCINNTTLVLPNGATGCWQVLFPFGPEPVHNAVLHPIDVNDTRMQQVTYANGMLFGALDTALKVGGKTQAGIEWFSVTPRVSDDGLSARLSGSGYLGARNTNLSYPALTVNENGDGVMAFTLLGPKDYPSAAYTTFNVESGMSKIHIAAAGVGPDDGFSNYAAYGLPIRTRWGDYGAAVVDGNNIWIASEYIGQTCSYLQYTNFSAGFGSCGATRTTLANWDTRITELNVEGSEHGQN